MIPFSSFGSCPLPRSLRLPSSPALVNSSHHSTRPYSESRPGFPLLGPRHRTRPARQFGLFSERLDGHHDGPPSGCSPLLPRRTQAFFLKSPFRFRIEPPRRMTSFITLKPPAAVSRICDVYTQYVFCPVDSLSLQQTYPSAALQ